MSSIRKAESFWMVLPSNSNMDSDPRNRPEEYTVRLRTPITFDTVDQDTSAWEVALLSIDYTNSFINVPETTVRCWVGIGSVKKVNEQEPTTTTRIEPHLLTGTYMHPVSRFLVREMLAKKDRLLTHDNVVFGEFVIPAGTYLTIENLAKVFCQKFDEVFKPRYGITLNIETDPETKMLTFRNSINETVRYFFTSRLIPRFFGCQASQPNIFKDSPDLPRNPELRKIVSMEQVGKRQPEVYRYHSMYVYCDIIQFQIVGDADAQLLGIIPINGESGERRQYNVTHLNYIPLSQSAVSSISVHIRDDKGNKMPFVDKPDPVNISLRFRKKKELMW
jgi:hypothetical protein